MSAVDFYVILPELGLAMAILVGAAWGSWSSRKTRAARLIWVLSGLFVALALWAALAGAESRSGFGGAIVQDGFSRFVTVAVLLSAALSMVVSEAYLTRRGFLRFEYPILMSLSVLGMLIMISSADLLVMVLGLELMALPLYALGALRRGAVRVMDVARKFLLLGLFSSALVLFGLSLILPLAQGSALSLIAQAAARDGGPAPGLMIGLALILAGLGMRILAAPFHLIGADLAARLPIPVAGFVFGAPVAASFGLLTRLLIEGFGPAQDLWQPALGALAGLSMLWGAVALGVQKDMRQVIVASLLFQTGTVLMGLAVANEAALQGALIQLAALLLINAALFAHVLTMESDGRPLTAITGLGQLAERDPGRALALLVVLCAATGLPPLTGFFGRLMLVQGALDSGQLWLIALSIPAGLIAGFGYLRLAWLLYGGDEPDDALTGATQLLALVLGGAALVLGLGMVDLAGIVAAAGQAAQALLN